MDTDITVIKDENKIDLSPITLALLDQIKSIPRKKLPDETSRISVSQTAAFFAIAYEKLRNAVEYREAHLMRRAAIERILKRRLTLNPQGDGEAENLIRELLWARYAPNESLGEHDVEVIQKIIDKYIYLRSYLLGGQTEKKKAYYSVFLFDLLTCEIEETLSPEEAQRNAQFTYFIFQVLKGKVKIEGATQEKHDAYLYISVERAFAKNDNAFLRYHLYSLSKLQLKDVSRDKLDQLAAAMPALFTDIDKIISNPHSNRIFLFVRRYIPPFHILFDLIRQEPSDKIKPLLEDRDKLWTALEKICREKYALTQTKLNGLAIKAIIYIFLTKMIFAIILEYPLSLYFYNEVNYVTIAINALFPALLMFLIVGLTRVPGADNTRRIFERLVDIIDADKSFETGVALITKNRKVRRPTLIFAFTVFYSLTFIITFLLLHSILLLLKFNAISEIIFILFVSLVAFFSYRIRQVAKQYLLREKDSIFRPFTDFFFMPVLSVGKVLSSGISKINIFGFVFDFFIEAPFKLIVEVVEEWVRFVRERREEII